MTALQVFNPGHWRGLLAPLSPKHARSPRNVSNVPDPSLPVHQASFQRLCDAMRVTVGHRPFTVSYIVPGGHEAERIFTNMPAVFPLQDRKPMDPSEWTRMMDRGERFVANAPDEFGEHFGDLDLIVSIGLGAVLNIPVHDAGRRLGTLNLLDVSGAYLGLELERCREFLPLAVEAFRQYEATPSTPSIPSPPSP